MKNLYLEEVKDLQDIKRVPAGGYICRITSATDVPEKEYLKLEYDIAEGEYSGTFTDMHLSFGLWAGNFYKSYKPDSLRFFKAFIRAVEASNFGFLFDYDETKLVKKQIGLVLQEEEYLAKDGKIKTKLDVFRIVPVEEIRKNSFVVPPVKKLPLQQPNPAAADFILISDITNETDETCPF